MEKLEKGEISLFKAIQLAFSGEGKVKYSGTVPLQPEKPEKAVISAGEAYPNRTKSERAYLGERSQERGFLAKFKGRSRKEDRKIFNFIFWCGSKIYP